MALVAYDNSDSSEYDDDENDCATTVTLNKKVEDPLISKPQQNGIGPSTSNVLPQDKATESPIGLFKLLPQPSAKKATIIEEDDEFLHKKATNLDTKAKVKITVPSLSDFKDMEDKPLAKPKISSGKQTGLLSMLPQPRNGVSTKTTTSLIPNVLTKKPNVTTMKKTLPSPVKKAKTEVKSLVNVSDESDDDEVQNDFFSINKPVELPIVEEPLDIEKPKTKSQNKPNQPFNIQSYFKQDKVQDYVVLEPDYRGNECSGNGDFYGGQQTAGSSYDNTASDHTSTNETALDEEAIMKLCGSRGKRKREDIQIVDVNQQEVLADAREWLLKGLMDDTSKRVSSSKRKGNEPTNQQKRKHQITYLAHQAKANEAELQNQWANSRISKRQTQSKYGF